MMLVALDVKEDDATIVEVESGANTYVFLDSMPSVPVAMDTLDDDDGLLLAVGV